MPRAPSVEHPLRTARVILDLSQAEFGKAVGVSGYSIQQIENGRLAMPVALARTISAVFRLDPYQLISGKNPEQPLMADGQTPFSLESFKQDAPRFQVDLHHSVLESAGRLICIAALNKGCPWAVLADYAAKLKALVHEFELEDEIRVLAEKQGFKDILDHLDDSPRGFVLQSAKLLNAIEAKSDGTWDSAEITQPISRQSSKVDKSPKKTGPPTLPPGPGNGAKKPSVRRRVPSVR